MDFPLREFDRRHTLNSFCEVNHCRQGQIWRQKSKGPSTAGFRDRKQKKIPWAVIS